MRRDWLFAIAVHLALTGAQAAVAEQIVIPVGSQGSATSELQLPARGSTATSVVATWGEPELRHAPVGQPPITRWDYAQFSVYFENDSVVHAVLRHRSPEPTP
jgi:hypothetical protein